MAELSSETIEEIANVVSEKLSESTDLAAQLGTLTDIWVLIALIIPGFIAFRVMTWIAAHDKQYPQFESTLYFLALSLGVFFLIHLLDSSVDFSSLDKIRISATNPDIVAKMLAYGLIIGIVGGLILKFTILKDRFSGSAWDQFVKRNVGKYVRVSTNDGSTAHVYSGYIKTASTGKDEKKEISLADPAVLNDKKEWEFLGPELFLSEGIIKNIEKMKT